MLFLVYCIYPYASKLYQNERSGDSFYLGMMSLLGQKLHVKPAHQVVYKGSNTIVHCEGGEVVYWKFNTIIKLKPSVMDKQIIVISNATDEDTGKYTCFARVEGELKEVTAEIIIAGKLILLTM